MRGILLLTILIVGFYLPTYSQFDSQLRYHRPQVDTSFSGLSLKHNLRTPFLFENKDPGWLFYNPIQDIKLSDQKLNIEQDLFANNKIMKTFDNMPCLNPQGFSPMPIFVPDSTVRYTLLIKK